MPAMIRIGFATGVALVVAGLMLLLAAAAPSGPPPCDQRSALPWLVCK